MTPLDTSDGVGYDADTQRGRTMSTTADATTDIPTDLLERAMALPLAAKERLAMLMLDAAAGPPDDPELVRKENHTLIADRIEGLLSGRHKLVDPEEMIRRVREKLLQEFPQ